MRERTKQQTKSILAIFSLVFALGSIGCGANGAGPTSLTTQQAPPPMITTFAGNGSEEETGQNGDNGDALEAQCLPFDVAADAAGNLYIADVKDHTIRKVDALTGVITTVAGNGTAGFSGDNGPAMEAQLLAPFCVEVDSFGNLFIADTGNQRIRRVDATTQTITTVAGDGVGGFGGDNGPATEAQLYTPLGITVDVLGNLYVSEGSNHRIRKIDTNGTITTIAGNGTNGFTGDNMLATDTALNGPWGLVTDDENNLYFSDSTNSRVRRIDAQTGFITTVAGDGTNAFSGDDGDASLAQLNGPVGVEMDANGNLLISEDGSDRIRQINLTTNIITTLAGNGMEGFSGDNGAPLEAELTDPLGIAVDPYGNLFISDRGNYRVRKVTP